MNIKCLDGIWMRFWVAAIGGCCLFAGNSLAGPYQFGDEAMVEVVTSYRPLINDQNPNSKENVVRYERDARYMAINRHSLPEYPRQKRVANKQKVNRSAYQKW
jgi:hypothetical protein